MLSLARHAMSFWDKDAPAKQRISHSVKWAAAVDFLGANWILNQKVLRKEEA